VDCGLEAAAVMGGPIRLNTRRGCARVLISLVATRASPPLRKITNARRFRDKGNRLCENQTTVRTPFYLANKMAVFEASGLFTKIVFLDILDFGIRAEYIEVLIARKLPHGRTRAS
jgi:hypothetical protein